jgi:hypothetical protein
MDKKNSINCPVCRNTDKVQKLSALFTEALLRDSDRTVIEKLGPPLKPKFNGFAEKYMAANQKIIEQTEKSIGCLTALLVWFVSLILPFVLWFYIAARISFAIFGAEFDMDASFPSNSLFAPVLLAIIFVPPGLLIFFGVRRRRRFKRETLPTWLPSLRAWSQQYRCGNCDHLFIPDAGMPPGPIEIDWDKLTLTKDEERREFEKTMNVFSGMAREDRCVICDKEINSIQFTHKVYGELPALSDQKLKTEAHACPECHAVYCKKCRYKALGFTFADQFTKAVCVKCKAAIPKQDVLVNTNGWFESFPKLQDIEAVRRPVEVKPA